MYISRRNKKVGTFARVLSRPVGDTCSPTCPTRDICYARLCEARFPPCREAAKRNLQATTAEFVDILQYCKQRNRPLRLHERGDFGNGKPHSIDARYVDALERALDKVSGVSVWTYTHIYHPRLAELTTRGVSVYASIDSNASYNDARKVGFDRFARVIPYRKQHARKNLHKLPIYNGPRFLVLNGQRYLVCPAVYHPKHKQPITCVECRYCIDARGNVAFLTH